MRVTVEVNDSEKAKSILTNTSWIKNLESTVNEKLIFNLSQNEVSDLNKYLVENGISVNALVPTRSLEEYFLNITQKASG